MGFETRSLTERQRERERERKRRKSVYDKGHRGGKQG